MLKGFVWVKRYSGLTPCATQSKAECLVTQFGCFLLACVQHERPICFISSGASHVGIPHNYSTTATAKVVKKRLLPQTLTEMEMSSISFSEIKTVGNVLSLNFSHFSQYGISFFSLCFRSVKHQAQVR